MKDFRISIVLILLFFWACQACNRNGNTDNANGDKTNQEQIEENSENYQYSIPEELKYGQMSAEFLYDKFFPIGWSKDGKFAYITEPADEGSGYYWFEIVIIDIVNNKISWSWKPAESEEGDFEKVWKDNYELFKRQLTEAEIIQQTNFELKSTKTSYKGNDYEFVLDVKNEIDQDFGFEVVKEIDLKIISTQLGQKSLIKQKEEDYPRVIGAIIPGYLMCPFDDRIVVIYKKDRIGYEGPPNVVYFRLIGSDLIRGFKKDKDS